jgi:hypothetical protein
LHDSDAYRDLRVECTKCARKARYSVRRLIEKYGRKANMMKWKEQLNGDCPKRDARTLHERCDLICPIQQAKNDGQAIEPPGKCELQSDADEGAQPYAEAETCRSQNAFHLCHAGSGEAITKLVLSFPNLCCFETDNYSAIPSVPAPIEVLACPARSWRAVAFSAGGDGDGNPLAGFSLVKPARQRRTVRFHSRRFSAFPFL